MWFWRGLLELFQRFCNTIFMRRQTQHGFWFYFSRIAASIGILLILLLLCIYLTVPTYSFKVPEPFEGQYLYNPYQDMNPEQWRKYNFHCHSRRFFGLTNGRKSTETAIDSVYQALGYDHYGISDYMSINRHNTENEDFIPAYEHGYGLIRKTHQICIGAEKVYWLDFPFMQNLNLKQHTINKLGERSRFVMPAHSSFTKGYKVNDMRFLSNYRLIEVLNPYGNAFEHWDMALSNGHRVYALGSDDTHNVSNVHEVCRNFTIINTPDLKAESVYEALDKGLCYAVEFDNWYYYPLSLAQKVKEMHELHHLTRAQLVGDTLFVETSTETMRQVQFIGQGGKVRKTMDSVATAYYVIQPEDPYIRTRIDINGRHFLYLNPVTRHPSSAVSDCRLDSVNYAQSFLYWTVYAVAFVALLWYLIKKKQEIKAE